MGHQKYRVIQNDCRDKIVQRQLRTKFGKQPPSDNSIRRWNGQFHETGYVCIPELKVRIRTAIETITADMLRTVWNELDYRVDVCWITKGAHIWAPVRYVTKTWGVALLNLKKKTYTASQVYCVWQVVKTPTIILNNPVLGGNIFPCHHKFYMDWFWLNPEIQGKKPVNNHLIAGLTLKPVGLKLWINRQYIFLFVSLFVCMYETEIRCHWVTPTDILSVPITIITVRVNNCFPGP